MRERRRVIASWFAGCALTSCQALLDFTPSNTTIIVVGDGSSVGDGSNPGDGGVIADGAVTADGASVTIHASTRRVAVGGQHACALGPLGNLYCWGNDVHNEFGVGSPRSDHEPVSAAMVDTGAGSNLVTRVAAGLDFTCTIHSSGDVYCAGRNNSRQTSALQTNEVVTTKVALPKIAARDVCASDRETSPNGIDWISHACALLDDGAVWCWGANDAHQVSNDFTTTSNPTKVKLAATGVRATAVLCGAARTCAILENRDLECWGSDGDGNEPGPQYAAHRVAGDVYDAALLDVGTYVVHGDGTLVSIAPGLSSPEVFVDSNVLRVRGAGDSVCATLTSGKAKCLAGSGYVQNALQEQLDTFASLDLDDVSLGRFHMCGVTSAGRVTCFGRNAFGEVAGDGVKTTSFRELRSFDLK